MPTAQAQAQREKHAAAASSVVAALFLTGMKIVVGWLTGSLGIMAEAAHSGLDLVAAGVTLLAVRLSGRPADSEHTYGHGKVENLSALVETLLLLATCAWIIYEAGERLFFHQVEVEPSLAAFVVLFVSIIIDYSRSRMLLRVAKAHDSQALEADALHFATDIWSSSVVIVGLACVVVSRWSAVPWLAQADAVAALGVSAIVIWVSIQLGHRTITALLDGVPSSLRDDLARLVRVAGVVDVRRVRARRSGAETFADVVLVVERTTSLEEAHAIAHRAEDAARAFLPRADVIVHVEPAEEADESLLTTVRRIAREQGLAAHELRLTDVLGRRTLVLHLELDGHCDVTTAHARATDFEEAARRAVPSLARVITHLEPREPPAPPPLDDEQIGQIVTRAAHAQPLVCTPHELEVTRAGGSLALAFHCTVSGSASLEAAHEATERLERAIREQLPALTRVTIHVEPPETNSPAS